MNTEFNNTTEILDEVESSENLQKTIKISEVLELLDKGYSRTSSDNNYDPKIGSISEYYNLSTNEIKQMFKHPALKGKKTKKPSTFVLFDDTNNFNQ